jgi:23S rRNA pseudouridine1911/1915/1917 synthase
MKKQGQSWIVREEEAGLRLDKWLAAPDRLASRSRSLDALAKGKVFVNDAELSEAARKLQAGETVRLWMDRPGSAERRYSERRSGDLHLLYEDASLLVANKPAGLLSVPLPAKPDEPSLLDQIKTHLRSHRKLEARVVHRIDRDTTGLVIFAKTPAAQHALKDQFESRGVERTYLALVHGQPRPEAGEWRDLLEWDADELKQQRAAKPGRYVKEAVCRYRVLEHFDAASLLEVSLVTGKRNQIRIQADLHGNPLIGEKMYASRAPVPRTIAFTRQALHAHRLRVRHPVDGRPMAFEAPLPDDFQMLCQKLRVRATESRPESGGARRENSR